MEVERAKRNYFDTRERGLSSKWLQLVLIAFITLLADCANDVNTEPPREAKTDSYSNIVP